MRSFVEVSTRDVPGRRASLPVVALVGVLLALAGAVSPAVPSAAAQAPSPGQLYAFGDNSWGQLGNGTETSEPNSTPALVALPGEVGTVTQAASGGTFSLVVTSGGQLYAFGSNEYGELGDASSFADHLRPSLVSLPGGSGGVTDAAGGRFHSLAVTSSGQLYAFGDNGWGQLGVANHAGATRANPTPTLVTLPGATGPVRQVSAGDFHSLALTSTGQLYAFGDNFYGQLGSAPGDDGDHLTMANPTPRPVRLPGATGPVSDIAAGGQFSLAVTSTGQLYAFGENDLGELGNTINNLSEKLEPNPTPALVSLPGEVGPVVQVAAGDYHSLALTATGQVYAFGYNQEGQLGNSVNLERWAANPTPRLVSLPGASGRVIRIAAGQSDSFALTSTGEVYAFGDDFYGELGVPPGEKRVAPHPTPIQVALPANAESIATGCDSSTALVVIADLAVSRSSLPAGETGVAYSANVRGSGGAPPYRWSASGLPPGLSIDPASGAISGTPTAGGRYTPTITVSDSYGIEASASPVLTVAPLPSPLAETAPFSVFARLAGAGAPATERVAKGVGGDRARRNGVAAAATVPSSTLSPAAVQPAGWTVHKYIGQITEAGGRTLERPLALAFDSAGDLFMSDAEEAGGEREMFLERFGPTNAFECQLGGELPDGEAQSLSVNDETGEVYVGETHEDEVWRFVPEAGCAYEPRVGESVHGHLFLAVDNAPGAHHGDLYLVESSEFFEEWYAYDIVTNADGGLTATYTELPEPPPPPRGFAPAGGEATPGSIAVDPVSGRVYVANPQRGVVDVYNANNEVQSPLFGTGEPTAVAVDPSNGEVYAIEDAEHDVVDEFNSEGELIGEITGAAKKFVEPRDVAVKPSTHEVYVSDPGAHAVDIFGPDEEAPRPAKPSTEAASGIGPARATLNGSLERKASEPLAWYFRYAKGSSCPDRPGTEKTVVAENETGVLHEHATIEGLEPASEYTVCFSDEGAEGARGLTSAESFQTQGLAPEAGSVSAVQISPSGALLEGSVNPQNEATTYRFQYATNATFTGASTVGEASFAKGVYPSESVEAAWLAGLAPDTTYYVRLVAENATGRATGPATSFTTLAASGSAVSFWSATEGETVAEARFEGYVNADYQSTTCAFQYVSESEHATHGFEGAASVPCAPSPFGSATTPFAEVVSATASGLQAGATYDYRLVAENETGSSEGPVAPATATYTTWGPPQAATGPAEGISDHGASLTGAINPDRLTTSYSYEYATEAAYAKANEEHKPNPYVGGDSTPTQNAGSNASRQTLPATAISGLQADTTYHYRLVATNEAGTRYGQDETFTTTAEQSTATTTTTTTTQSASQTPATTTTTTSATTSQRQGGETGKPGHKSARLTSAQKLKRALNACRRKRSKKARTRCERQAHLRYGPAHEHQHRDR